MEQTKYLIGDVAGMVGLSRDTLRYYERRGILSSQKTENGYRYYTDQDIMYLSHILYQRKMNIGLDDIEMLHTNSDNINLLNTLTQSRIDEELREIRIHQQTIARLKLTRNDCENIHRRLNHIELKNFPSAYVIVPQTTFENSVPEWLKYSKQHSGLDMMYTFDEYSWDLKNDQLSMSYKNTQLVLFEELREYVDYDIPEQTTPMTSSGLCVSTLCSSSSRIPPDQVVLPMIQWAQNQGLILSRQLYSTYTTYAFQHGQHSGFLQIYIPVF